MINDQKNQGVAGIEGSESRSFKWLFRYLPAENSVFTTRIDYKMAYPGRSRGMLLFEDINYSFKMIPVTLWFRYCLFSTESWDSRLYTYENDLLYSFSIPALSGEGSRCYFMAKFDLGHFGEMRIKYGLTSIIDTGNKNINSDEIKMQLRIWF
jgi:hypothetical protein